MKDIDRTIIYFPALEICVQERSNGSKYIVAIEIYCTHSCMSLILYVYSTILENEGTEEFKARVARAAKLASEIEDKEMTKHSFDDTGTEEEL